MEKAPVAKLTEQMISQLLDRYFGKAVRVHNFADDENLTGWEFETSEKFDPELIMDDIQNYFSEKYEDVEVELMV